jgi:hypothetical protein
MNAGKIYIDLIRVEKIVQAAFRQKHVLIGLPTFFIFILAIQGKTILKDASLYTQSEHKVLGYLANAQKSAVPYRFTQSIKKLRPLNSRTSNFVGTENSL